MASLDNFHTNNGSWVRDLHTPHGQHMNAIGLGLHSPDRFDPSVRVPIPSPLDEGKRNRQQPQPAMMEYRDGRIRDLFVPLGSQGVTGLKGDHADSILLYDKAGARMMPQCPLRRLGGWMKREVCVPSVLRYRPY